MRIYTVILLFFCSTISYAQALKETQKVALGSKMDYSVAVQHPIKEKAYSFFWSIDGRDVQRANEGQFGRYDIEFSKKFYKVGNEYTLSVYMQRELEKGMGVCPSNMQELNILIIEKPIVTISNSNIVICSYAEANAHTPLIFDLHFEGYKGLCKIIYDVENEKGLTVFSSTLDAYDTSELSSFEIDEIADDRFVNLTKSNVKYLVKIKSIVFLKGNVSNKLDYSKLTSSIEVLPAVDLGKITF
ncbi:MAG: hypothetical protein WBG43_11375 [Marinifilaceae bacterium]